MEPLLREVQPRGAGPLRALGAGCCRALGVGCAAGAAAGFAVVPVAAQVDFDGQSAVGSCLVLAAVVCGKEGKRHRYRKEK